MTQADQILSALQQGREITPLDALNEFGCLRLAARVKDLRDAAHPISCRKKRLPNGKSVAAYYLELN